MKLRATHLFPAVILLSNIVSAQVATGTPPFSSPAGGPFDTVNLGNLNVHFTIPIVHKAGRGMPFSYDLSFDNSIWYPVSSNGTTSWQPVQNWGWHSATEAATGYSTYVTSQGSCPGTKGGTLYFDIFTFTSYHDAFGVSHPFNVSVDSVVTLHCSPPFRHDTASAGSNDGSGLTLNALAFSTNARATITTRSGQVLSAPALVGTGAGNITDANGNQITVNSSGQFFDTLSSTTPVLTVAGSAPNPVTFTYNAPTGTQSQSYTLNYKPYTLATNFGLSGMNEYPRTSVSLVDNITLPDGSKYSFTYESTPGVPASGACTPLAGTTSCVTGRISTLTLNTGGTIVYGYTGGSNGIRSDGSSAGLTRQVDGGTWSYSRSNIAGSHWQTTINDPVTPTANQTVIDFQKDSSTTTPSQNFFETQRLVYQGSTSGTLLNTTITCYNGNGVSTPASCSTTAVSSPITRTTVFHYLPNSSGLQAETDTTIDQFGLTREVDEYGYGSAAVGSLIRKTITTYASLGNGIVDRPSSVIIQDSGNNTEANTAYGYDETTPTTTSGTPQHISITGSRGLLTSVAAQASGTTTLYRKYTYYDTGTLSTSTDVSTSNTTNGIATTYNYGSGSCGNSFVTSITEPLGLSRSMTWDCNGGVTLSLTDENGNPSSTAYSGSNYTNYFWRPYSTTDQAGTVTDYSYILNSSNQLFQTEGKYHSTFNGGNSTVDILNTTDGFGRTIFRQTKQSPTASNYDTVATCYDSSGRVSLTTLPYSHAAITSATTTCPSSNNGTSYAYDALSRQTSVSDSGGGSTTYTYSKNDVLQVLTSPTQQKELEYDALGQLKSVCEITNGTTAFPGGTCAQNVSPQPTGYWTTYAYDLLGNLTGVTQNAQAPPSAQQTRSYVYDMLGRLTQEINPETKNSAVNYTFDTLTSDSACGTYTSAGNPVKRLDAPGNAACYSGYDALHRVGAITYPPTGTPAKHFVYDAATVNGTSMTNAKTRLARAYTCIGTCSSNVTDLFFSYSATGQTSDVWELTPHSGTNNYYRVTSTYWPNGVVNTLRNLTSLPTITYLADGEGRLGTVSATTGIAPITAVTYNEAERVTALTYGASGGSGDSDSFQFYPQTGRMMQYQFTVGTTPKTDTGVLTWNPNGTLQTLVVTDNVHTANSQTCTYAHDDLGRVASANCGSTKWSQNFSYDPFGNITKTVPNGATGMTFNVNYDYTGNTNQITTVPYSYTSTSDPNGKTGNMTADAAHAYSWDTDGHVTGIDAGGASGVCLTYDALGRAVEKGTGAACPTSPTTSTEIVYSPAGSKLALMNGASLVKAFIPLPGGAQAIYNASGLQYYRHPDWLGSSRIATTPARASYYDVAYAPFGEPYLGTGTQDLSFTGQNQDTETSTVPGGAGGLYDFLYREHSPVQGRWLSPDPLGFGAANPADPQSWNRYAYVGNRPLALTDSKGLEFCGTDLPCNNCDDPDAPPEDCFPLPIPTPPPDPPSPHPPISRQPQRIGGVWLDNQTPGLPIGLGSSPADLGSLLGLSPGTQCGDFVACDLLGMSDPTSALGFQEQAPTCPLCHVGPKKVWIFTKIAIDTLIYLSKSFPTIQELQLKCRPGALVVEPSTSRPGWTSEEQEYICPAGIYTVHCLVSPTGKVRDCHVRPGPPKGGGS